MSRPNIRRPSSSSSNAKTKAHKLAKECEQHRDHIRGLEGAYEDDFPEAIQRMNIIGEEKATFEEMTKKTSAMVREAGETIGDFKYSSPKGPDYDPDIIMSTLQGMTPAECGNAVKDMISAGVIKGLSFDKKSCNIFFGTNDKIAQKFSDAYCEGGKEMTARITPMKL